MGHTLRIQGFRLYTISWVTPGHLSTIDERILRNTAGISAVFATRNARPGSCFGILSGGSVAVKHKVHNALPRRLRSFSDTDQRCIHFGLSRHCTFEFIRCGIISPEVRVGNCDNKPVIYRRMKLRKRERKERVHDTPASNFETSVTALSMASTRE